MKAILGYCYCIDTKKKKKIVKTKKNLQNNKKTLVHFLNTKNIKVFVKFVVKSPLLKRIFITNSYVSIWVKFNT